MNGEGSESDVREPAGGEDVEVPLSDDAVPVCPNCMAALSSETRYCPNCGRPVGTFATTDPIQLIHSQSWGYLAVARGRPNRLMFWGMWLVFGPATVLMLGNLWGLARYGAAGLTGWLGGLLVLGLQVAYVALLYRVTKNYIRHRRYAAGKCGVCKYDLRLLTEPRCPECGTQFDPEWLPEHFEWGRSDQNVT